MKIKNKTLLTTGILCLVGLLINALDIYLDFTVYSGNIFYIVLDSFACAISLATGITFIVMSTKSIEFLTKNLWVLALFTFLNIFNNIIIWLITLWAQFSVSSAVRRNYIEQSMRMYKKADDGSIVLDKDMYKVTKMAHDLGEELDELERQREKNEVSESEYAEKREEIIKRYILDKDNGDNNNA